MSPWHPRAGESSAVSCLALVKREIETRSSEELGLPVRTGPHLIDIAEDRPGNLHLLGRPRLLIPRGFVHFFADFLQFAGVEPVTAAAGAFVNFDAPSRAEVAALQLDAGAFGTVAFTGQIDVQRWVALHLEQQFPGRFPRFVHLLQFKRVEPYAAAAAAADIDGQFANGD